MARDIRKEEISKKKSFISDVDKKNLGLTVVGGGSGCIVPLTLKLYCDPLYPDGIPIVKEVVPWPWSSPSTFISMVGGAVALVAGIFIKPARYFLLPFGVTSLVTGTMLALVTPPLESRLNQKTRVPAGNQRIPGNQNISGNVKLVSAGPLKSGNPGLNFMQKNPEQRLAELKKESASLETQQEVEKLEADIKFKKQQPSGIPLRT